jgi:hypothetical protein
MSSQRLLIVLSVVNLALLGFLLIRPAVAAGNDAAPILRGRALQLVDERGRVRASIDLYPADPNVTMPDGTRGYPETVVLRLISSKGAPNVKLAATEDGSALVLGGEANPTHIQLLSRGAATSITLSDKDGHSQVIKP